MFVAEFPSFCPFLCFFRYFLWFRSFRSFSDLGPHWISSLPSWILHLGFVGSFSFFFQIEVSCSFWINGSCSFTFKLNSGDFCTFPFLFDWTFVTGFRSFLYSLRSCNLDCSISSSIFQIQACSCVSWNREQWKREDFTFCFFLSENPIWEILFSLFVVVKIIVRKWWEDNLAKTSQVVEAFLLPFP